MLLERPGEVVTREELQQRLWPDGTFVDFDHSLNTAINKIRDVLGDSAENPRFVETLPRRGYRFVAAVENAGREIQTEKAEPDFEVLAKSNLQAGIAETLLPEKESPHKKRWWVERAVWLSALSVLIVGGLAWFYLSRLGSRSLMLPPMKVVRLTSFPGQETQPSLSPDGKMVAFVWDGEKGDNRDIYVMLVDAGAPLRLTTDPGDDFSPAWSPDGRYIAFARASKEGGGYYLVPALGGPERRVTVSSNPGHLDWSPDGKLLAISDTSSSQLPTSIFLLAVETGEKKQLTSTPVSWYGDLFPAFSPDGKTLAFTRSTGFIHLDVYVVSVLGGEPKRLTFNEFSWHSAWTSDSREIIFGSGIEGTGKLYRISAQGGTVLPLATGGEFGGFPSISRDGRRLVYNQAIYDTDIWRIELRGSKGKGSLPSRLISSSQVEDMPHFSPDGKKIVFHSMRSGSPEIWVCDSDGRNPIKLTSFGKPFINTGTPRWSPDGKLIAFDSRPKGLSDIFVISAEGGSPRCLTEETSDDMVPSWSRDGRWIYFGSNRSGKGDWQLWKLPVEGGQIVRVTRNGGFEAAESFDGKFIYYSKQGFDDIWKSPVSGGQETLVLRNVEWRYWALAEQGIYFITREGRDLYVEFMDFASGHVTRITRLEKKLATDANRGLALSPDGRSLLSTLVEQDTSDIMLVENFR
jgi:Tol biopolymer transport system component